MPGRLCAAGLVLVLAGCAGDTPPPSGGEEGPAEVSSDAAEPASLDLVDPEIPPAVAGEGGWNYRQLAEADLTGDGIPERVVLTARVELYRGRPAWDDGQPWQVYVEAENGELTYLYARRLQLGTLTMRVALGVDGGPPTIVFLEHLPDRLSLYEATYLGPGRASVLERFQRDLDPRGEVASPRLP